MKTTIGDILIIAERLGQSLCKHPPTLAALRTPSPTYAFQTRWIAQADLYNSILLSLNIPIEIDLDPPQEKAP